jgi:hypothetical protein
MLLFEQFGAFWCQRMLLFEQFGAFWCPRMLLFEQFGAFWCPRMLLFEQFGAFWCQMMLVATFYVPFKTFCFLIPLRVSFLKTRFCSMIAVFTSQAHVLRAFQNFLFLKFT